jgi:hypothetical protein
MSKLITILLFIPILANGQIQLAEDWSFKNDKKLHAISGVVISIPSYYGVYSITGDFKVSRNAAWMFPAFAALGKEFSDAMGGGEFSVSDISYTIGSAIITTIIMTSITKRRYKKRQKRFEIEF